MSKKSHRVPPPERRKRIQSFFAGDMCGEMDTQLFEEFFRSFAFNAGITLHISAPYGVNDHHKAEAMFKALARALRTAVEEDPRFAGQVVSTKGAL